MEGEEDNLPFDIRAEVGNDINQPIIDNEEEQKRLAQHIKDARNKINNNITMDSNIDQIKVDFNSTIHKLSELEIEYDELLIKNNIKGIREIKKEKINEELEKLNEKLKLISRNIQSIYTKWSIINAS